MRDEICKKRLGWLGVKCMRFPVVIELQGLVSVYVGFTWNESVLIRKSAAAMTSAPSGSRSYGKWSWLGMVSNI